MYTNRELIEAKYGKELPVIITDDILDIYIDEVQDYINSYTENNFEATASSSKIYSSKVNTNWIPIDDLLVLGKVEYLQNRTEEGDTWQEFVTTDYRMFPENSFPKTMIRFNTFYPLYMEGGNANIRVTGVFGYSSTVPATIAMVATELAIALLRDRGDIDSDLRSEKVGDLSYTYNIESYTEKRDKMNRWLDRYKKIPDIMI